MASHVEGVLSRDSTRADWLVGGAVFAITLALVFFRIDRPPVISFDEAHYVPAARDLAGLVKHTNTEHPIFAKETIALGLILFGDNPFGWRVFGALLMSFAPACVFGMGRMLGLSRPAALLAAFLLLMDQTLFVMARTAMLDPHSIGWFVLFLTALVWSAQPRRSLLWAVLGLAASGVFFGLAGAAKWSAIFNGGMVWLGVLAWQTFRPDDRRPWSQRLHKPSVLAWPRLTPFAAPLICALFFFTAYFATFWPLFYLKQGAVADFGGFMQAQLTIFKRSELPLAHHPYQSLWWEWPFQWQPIWFYFKDVPDDPTRIEAVFYVGNFFVYWVGALAAVACIVRGVARVDGVLLGVGLTWAAFWLIWAVIPKKIGFFYYYAPASLLLGPAIAAAIERIAPRSWRIWLMGGAAAAAFAGFAWYYPGLSGLATPKQSWDRWTIAKHWVSGRPDPKATPSSQTPAPE